VRSTRRAVVGLLAVIVAVGLALPAWGEEPVELTRGTPAPYDGTLLDLQTVKKVVEDVRDARALARENDLLKQQLKEMQATVRAQEIALAKAEAREEIRKEMDARFDQVLGETRRTLEDTRALIALYEKQMERLERRMLVTQILGVLGPLGMGIAILMY
jgi:hypothetical protein